MSSFDYCKKCEFPRHIEGYQGIADYFYNGWVELRTTKERISKHGVSHESTISEWLCPVCAEAEDADRKALMEIGSVRKPEKLGRYGSVRNDRST